jgi:predicted nucleic acid-binding protein
MSGDKYLLDTNIIIYGLKGVAAALPYFDESCYTSVITEIEILGVKGLSKEEMKIRENAINFCSVITLSNPIKNLAIQLKRKHKIKVPDAIIAATAIVEDITLVTADKGFKNIQGLQVILIVP